MRTSTFDLVFLTVLIAGAAYFTVDAWVGPSGAASMSALQETIDGAEARNAALRAQRDALASRVESLRGPDVDVDLLDERLRATFGLGRADERLIIAPPAR